jgi:hypothetical protein
LPTLVEPPISLKLIRHRMGVAKKLDFQVFRGHVPVFCAKMRDRKVISIGAVREFHAGIVPLASIEVHDKSRVFRVVDAAQNKELLVITFSLPGGRGTPRAIDIRFTEPPDDLPAQLTNRKAAKGPDGGWVINMAGRFARGSIKNSVMIDMADNEFLVARMTAKDDMVVESRPEVGELRAVAFGLASFICHL